MQDRNWGGWRKWLCGALLTLLTLAVALVAGVVFLPGYLRGLVVRYAEAHWNRPIRIEGAFHAELLTWHPRLVADAVFIENPPWMPPGEMARIGQLAVTYDLPWAGRPWSLRALRMERATFHLLRDEQGRANWQALEPGTESGPGPPLIHSLSMPDARIFLDDARRRLKFDGTLSAREPQGPESALQFEGQGQLNGRPARFSVTGDPLAGVRREQPYGFRFTEESSASRLSGQGVLPHPFDLLTFAIHFTASGENLKDLYYLTGVGLPDTGTYRLSGRFARQAEHLEFTDLEVHSGQSDLSGRVQINATADTPLHIEADLRSQKLRMSDLGAAAAGRAPPKPTDAQNRVLPETPLNLSGARGTDAVVRFRAQVLEAGRFVLRSLEGKARVDHGVIEIAPLSAAMREGKVTGRLSLNVNPGTPTAAADVRATGLQLGALEGPLQARITVKGTGRSLHQIAADANGTVTAVLPHGAVRSSIAELAGLNLRALGLVATGNQADTPVRCGVASFSLKDGTLTADRLVMDTEPVLITGEGSIELGSEALDLRLRGRPHHVRLRLRAPLLVRGTFRHPQFSLDAAKPAVQAGGAVALGAVLTPLAALLAFVDPGLAQDADCAALLSQSDRVHD